MKEILGAFVAEREPTTVSASTFYVYVKLLPAVPVKCDAFNTLMRRPLYAATSKR